MSNDIKELRITEEDGDVIDVLLTPEKTPNAYKRKMHELMHVSGMTQEEAENYLLKPIPIELFYEYGWGLFGMENEALTDIEAYSPYTGKEIPNDNLSKPIQF